MVISYTVKLPQLPWKAHMDCDHNPNPHSLGVWQWKPAGKLKEIEFLQWVDMWVM